MGMSCMRMMETMAALKVLAEENLQTLKENKQWLRWKDEYDILQMNDRIKKINEFVKTMNYDWDHIPKEWDDDKKMYISWCKNKKGDE